MRSGAGKNFSNFQFSIFNSRFRRTNNATRTTAQAAAANQSPNRTYGVSLVRGSNDPVGKRCGEHETMLGMQNLRFPEADRGEKRLAPFGSRVQRGPFNRG